MCEPIVYNMLSDSDSNQQLSSTRPDERKAKKMDEDLAIVNGIVFDLFKSLFKYHD